LDGDYFDAVTRLIGGLPTRRGFARAVVGLLVSFSIGILVPGSHADIAARKKKSGGKGKGKGKGKSKGKQKGKGKGKTTAPSCAPGANDTSLLDSEESAFVGLLNAHRAANGLAPLAHHRLLGAAARAKSVDMALGN
jgi:hypothetical protein